LNEISRDNGQRRIYVEANVRGNDLGSFVSQAQARIAQDVRFAGRMHSRMGRAVPEPASRHRKAGHPGADLPAHDLRGAHFGAGRSGAGGLVFTAVPLALAGGVFAIALRGIPFSVSTAVGFIAVSGVAC
jgi:cobalt-zinc-cadmium resistance protein CzcA